jgi:AcrR family transcriptional regulator
MSTFFRHFPDKREVLFAGQDIRVRLLAEAVHAAPETAAPLEVVRAALDALAGAFTEDRRELAVKLRPIVGGHAELRERAAHRRTTRAAVMADALRERGVPDLTAGPAADLGLRAFDHAFERWTGPGNACSFTDHARRALEELCAAMPSFQD